MLQRDLATAQTTIANLQNATPKTVTKDKIIEKVVYRDRPIEHEKIVEKILIFLVSIYIAILLFGQILHMKDA